MILALASGALAAQPLVADDEVSDLRAELAAMSARVAQLENEKDETWLTEARSNEIRGLVNDVLADADTRSSLLQDGMTAGYDKHGYLQSADGNFRIDFAGQVQVRYVLNNRDVPDGSNEDSTRSGFEIRRTKIKLSGHVVDPSWVWVLNGAYDRSGGALLLEDAIIKKEFENGWHVMAGQFKAPLLWEELVSSSRQLLVDRSIVNELLNQDRAVGIQAGWESDRIRVAGMFHNGQNTDNNKFTSYDTEYAVAARIDFLGAGTWKQFKDFTSWTDDEFGWKVGGAFNIEKDENGTPLPNPKETRLTWTVDAAVEFGGANAFVAVIGRNLDEANRDQLAVIAQGGWMFVPDTWELFARYEFGDADLTPAEEDLNIITFGVNRYFKKHEVKWTTDIGFGLDEVTGTWDSSGVGWDADVAGQDGQIVFRSQLQLLF
ncbi:MAG: porin [Planctomycetota bacterium]|jgi:hypothetical protein